MLSFGRSWAKGTQDVSFFHCQNKLKLKKNVTHENDSINIAVQNLRQKFEWP